ncbi:outer dynein arm-docking complex subunit 4-like [Homalodisca vitripennis]|uniref:outer dynein arm-docking complex subunit 4-like n=1 Tax=Homalodisca vitripennis TaxID=197043 RepID=UPI001EEA5A5B|nr:outer dynein arm-docking complex subunit 4-like [Homalodisca vitripennis]
MTAIAAAEKKKKKDEMYYRFNTSRGMGYMKSRRRNYGEAAALFSTAIENAEPGFEVPLIIARSKAYSKLVDHAAARKDALDIVEKHPDEIRGLENDAFTLYEKDDFEDSLVQNYCGLRRRKKPDYFYKGILVGKETIEDCIGRNAGPCMDQDRLGRTIVDMHVKPKHHQSNLDDLAVAKEKYEKKRMDQFLAQKYLGRLAADKKFLMDFLEQSDLKSGNKEHNQQLEDLLTHMIEVINRQQETLMTQRPMYMLKHHEPKFSEKYKIKKRNVDNSWRGGVMNVIEKLLGDANALERDWKIEACLNVCDRLRRFVECQPSSLLSDRAREQVLDRLYDVIGRLFMDTKCFIPSWSEVDNEQRIEFILRSRIDDPRFIDRVYTTYLPRIWNVKEMKKDLESRLAVSIHRVERMYLCHELTRCLFEEGATEKAYKMVSGVYKIAQESRNLLWSFNLGFLIAVSVLLEGSVEDAKMTLTEVMIVARKLERDDCASFVQRAIKLSMEPQRLNYESEDPATQREKDIMKLMPTLELKARTNTVMQKILSAPRQAKLQLQPSTQMKGIGGSGSRWSMKATKRAKRRTLYEVMTHKNQTQKWMVTDANIPSSMD